MKKRVLAALLAVALCVGATPGALAAGDQAGGKLKAPTEVKWHTYYTVEGEAIPYNGMTCWREDLTQPEHLTEVIVYRDGEPVHDALWYSYNGEADTGRNDHDFINNASTGNGQYDLQAGTYQFSVQLLSETEGYADSDIVWSEEWTYTPPKDQLPAPTGLAWDGQRATWIPVAADGRTGGYCVQYYYSPDNANAASTENLERVTGFWWLFAERGGSVDAWDESLSHIGKELKDGYYYFSVVSVSADVEQWKYSQYSVLSPALKVGNPVPAPAFDDVPSWFAAAVDWAVDEGITNGYGNGKFGSTDPCTNAQILTFLWRAAGRPASSVTAPYTVESYYQDAVNWAFEKGIIGEGFVPAGSCTRASAVVYIWLAFGAPGANPSYFIDVPADAGYVDAVNWAVENGLTNGYGNNDFRPGNVCSRGEIVTFLHRAYVPEVRLNNA